MRKVASYRCLDASHLHFKFGPLLVIALWLYSQTGKSYIDIPRIMPLGIMGARLRAP